MSEQSNPITQSHPPKALLRLVVNPILTGLLRTPFTGARLDQFMVVDFTGRKTGRPYSLVLSAHLIDGILSALSGATWTANFRGGAPAQVLHDGKTTAMRGELITDTAQVADLYARCAESYGVRRAERVMGIGFRDHQLPPRGQFAEAVEQLGLRAIRFTPAT